MSERKVDNGVSGCDLNFWSAMLVTNESNEHLQIAIQGMFTPN